MCARHKLSNKGQNRGGCHVEHIEVIQYLSKRFQKLYDQACIAITRCAPNLMGFLYDRMDQPWSHPRRRLALSRLNKRPMIRRVQPELGIATHFEIIAWLIAKKHWRAPCRLILIEPIPG
jgi:hypothetical protein